MSIISKFLKSYEKYESFKRSYCKKYESGWSPKYFDGLDPSKFDDHSMKRRFYDTLEILQRNFSKYAGFRLATLVNRITIGFDDSLDCRTAYTDNVRIMFSPRFFAELRLEERMFVLAHEALHVYLHHLERAKAHHYNHYVHNLAGDFVINNMIGADNSSHFVIPKDENGKCNFYIDESFGGPKGANYKSMNSDEIYADLMKRAEEERQKQQEEEKKKKDSQEQDQDQEQDGDDQGNDQGTDGSDQGGMVDGVPTSNGGSNGGSDDDSEDQGGSQGGGSGGSDGDSDEQDGSQGGSQGGSSGQGGSRGQGGGWTMDKVAKDIADYLDGKGKGKPPTDIQEGGEGGGKEGGMVDGVPVPGGKGGRIVDQLPGGMGQDVKEPTSESDYRRTQDEIGKIEREAHKREQRGENCGIGTGSPEFAKLWDELNESTVNWKTVLKKFIGDAKADPERTFSIRNRKNKKFMGRRVDDGIVSRVAIYLDFSGSIGPLEMKQYMSELDAIFKNPKTKIDEVYVALWASGSRDDPNAFRKPEGGKPFSNARAAAEWMEKNSISGGTEIRLAVEDIVETDRKLNYDVILILTDGYVEHISQELRDSISHKTNKKILVGISRPNITQSQADACKDVINFGRLLAVPLGDDQD